MSFLADENFPRPAIVALRQRGFDVSWVVENGAGASDTTVLTRCINEDRTLLTLDKDFGELVFRDRAAAHCGVILFRVDARSPAELVTVVVAAIESQADWKGLFAVVTGSRIRITRLTGDF